MTSQQPQSNPVLDAFGKAVGFVVALVATMPTYHQTYEYFYHYAATYSRLEYLWLWKLVWLVALFALIVVTVWFALSAAIGLIKSLFAALFILLTLFRR